MQKNTFVSIIERFSKDFQDMASKLSKEFPEVNCRASYFIPSNDRENGLSSVYLDCIIGQVDDEMADNVSLSIVGYDHGQNTLIQVEIVWGDPSGKEEIRLFPEPVSLSDESVEQIWREMPRLYYDLRRVLRENPLGMAA